MRFLAVLLIGLVLALSGCLAEKKCWGLEPYEVTEAYNESVPYLERVCVNVTDFANRTDYTCTNFTYNETYTDRECEEKQVKFTTYSMLQEKFCDATYTAGANWDPICLRGHYECRFRITNVDSETGSWTFGMNASVTNGSILDLGEITKVLAPGETGLFNWSVGLEDLDDNMTCYYRIISVPRKTVCNDVLKNRTVTRQECEPVEWQEEVNRTVCTDRPAGYAIVEKNRTITRQRNVTKPC